MTTMTSPAPLFSNLAREVFPAIRSQSVPQLRAARYKIITEKRNCKDADARHELFVLVGQVNSVLTDIARNELTGILLGSRPSAPASQFCTSWPTGERIDQMKRRLERAQRVLHEKLAMVARVEATPHLKRIAHEEPKYADLLHGIECDRTLVSDLADQLVERQRRSRAKSERHRSNKARRAMENRLRASGSSVPKKGGKKK